MRTFEESLQRVLDPEGLYWRYPDDDNDDPTRERLIEIRLDVPRANVGIARTSMKKAGWQFASQPDDEADELQRLYFRKATALKPQDKAEFLTSGLTVAHETNGTLMTWISVEDLESD